jgi:proteasome assembly chaperone 3
MGLPQDPIMDEIIAAAPFPAETKQATGDINGLTTEATSISFSDKILITITQEGRLAQWVGLYSVIPSIYSSNRW